MPEFPEPTSVISLTRPAQPATYAGLIDNLRVLLDRIAGAGLDAEQMAALDEDIRSLTARLDRLQVPEEGQLFGRAHGVPGHGQTMSPAFSIDSLSSEGINGRITFGRFFLGANDAAHGGAIACVFDEILGIPANLQVERMARTAYLHVNYRAITPIDVELTYRAWVERTDGRKRFVRGAILHGEIVCADAEALFLELKPGQP